MKIAIVLPRGFQFCEFSPNSIETVVRSLNTPDISPHDVYVLCEAGARQRGPIKVIEIAQGSNRKSYHQQMLAALKALKPDFIEFHQHTVSMSKLARDMAHTPNALYRHNYVRPPKHLLDHWRIQWRNRHFKGFIFVSQATKNAFIEHYPQYRPKSFTVSNPIDATLWPGDVDRKTNTIVFCGRAAPEKGLAPLCEALAQTLPEYPQWSARLILGKFATHAQWTEAQISKLNHQAHIFKDLPLTEVKAQMSDAAIAVVPSLWEEPFGLTALEAMAAGCAVISSGRGGLIEASLEHALYLDKVSADEISEALKKLMDNTEMRKDMASSGQTMVQMRQTMALRADDLEFARQNILTTALNNGSRQ
ncbi:MAG: glycosyltransferase family 4 protein [Asticcacaulis sp.]